MRIRQICRSNKAIFAKSLNKGRRLYACVFVPCVSLFCSSCVPHTKRLQKRITHHTPNIIREAQVNRFVYIHPYSCASSSSSDGEGSAAGFSPPQGIHTSGPTRIAMLEFLSFFLSSFFLLRFLELCLYSFSFPFGPPKSFETKKTRMKQVEHRDPAANCSSDDENLAAALAEDGGSNDSDISGDDSDRRVEAWEHGYMVDGFLVRDASEIEVKWSARFAEISQSSDV